ncbi:hypothetical protein BRAO375_3370002 [Bradyrhizobium sp. ORS 375]|nr:hypothetical protein BRAO375_3370002 [Bradyrhizobium sp. ORS 375]
MAERRFAATAYRPDATARCDSRTMRPPWGGELWQRDHGTAADDEESRKLRSIGVTHRRKMATI